MGKFGEINKAARGREGIRGEETRRAASGVGTRICQIIRNTCRNRQKGRQNDSREESVKDGESKDGRRACQRTFEIA